MSDTLPEPEPATAALIARVRRLMLVTMGATFVVLAIVLMVIGYRVLATGESAPAAADMTLPPGARVVSSAIGDGRLALTIEQNGSNQVWLFDLKSLKPLGRIRLSPP